jgi:prepilin-type N-terminal cleavage/methylation domain-containing protein
VLRRNRAGGARRRGFSLLELLIVLALISLVASIAIPAFFERGEVTLDAAVRLLADDLRAAQDRAATLEVEIRVRFDEDGHGYAVLGPDGEPLESPVGGPFVRRWNRDGIFEGVRLVRLDIGEGREIVCRPDGTIAREAAVLLGYGDEVRGLIAHEPDGSIVLPGS